DAGMRLHGRADGDAPSGQADRPERRAARLRGGERIGVPQLLCGARRRTRFQTGAHRGRAPAERRRLRRDGAARRAGDRAGARRQVTRRRHEMGRVIRDIAPAAPRPAREEHEGLRRARRVLQHTGFLVLIAALRVVVVPALLAQGRGGANWNAVGADAQRTGWLKTETRISAEALQKPGALQLLWKVKPENQARQLNTLTQPLILGNLISHKGFKALAFVGGSGDVVYAYDYDLGKVYWSQKLSTATPAAGTPACPGGLTAIARSAPVNPNAPIGGRGPGGPQSGINPANLPITHAGWAISSDGRVPALNPPNRDAPRSPLRDVS